MSQETETVKQVCEEMCNDWARLYYSEGSRKKNGEYPDVVVIETEKVADRILAAHKREITAKKDEIEKIRSIAKRLADVMDKGVFCRNDCKACSIGKDKNIVCTQRLDRKLIAKAREACK